MSHVMHLTAAGRHRLPDCCVDCVFWQTLRGTTDRERKERWARAAESLHGSWGRMLYDGSRFRGMVQYGPAGAFPRSQVLPAGPPDRRSALITCTFLIDEDPAGTCERLVLEALADLKAKRVPAVDAFALRYPDEVGLSDRFVGHHTLLDRTFLLRLGFSTVRAAGQVSLMRLELGGLVSASDRVRAAVGRLRPAVGGGEPTPA
jgi:hypothetical protein